MFKAVVKLAGYALLTGFAFIAAMAFSGAAGDEIEVVLKGGVEHAEEKASGFRKAG